MPRKNYDPIPLPELRKALAECPEKLIGRVPGVHLVDKPSGITSYGAVAIARKKLGLRRIGHGGTLDPLASGLLVLFTGNATRLFDALQDFSKSYEAEMKLGLTTDTCDITGTATSQSPVPEISEDVFENALSAFRGPVLQVPPMYSALKRDGKPLYELARQGIEVEREAREVMVHSLEGEMIAPDKARLRMEVSKGFYVRTLIDDLGRMLGCGATMTALRRTSIGHFKVEDACAPEELENRGAPEL